MSMRSVRSTVPLVTVVIPVSFKPSPITTVRRNDVVVDVVVLEGLLSRFFIVHGGDREVFHEVEIGRFNMGHTHRWCSFIPRLNHSLNPSNPP
nr:hypothetical protein [Tanacetum cinerariifolium]